MPRRQDDRRPIREEDGLVSRLQPVRSERRFRLRRDSNRVTRSQGRHSPAGAGETYESNTRTFSQFALFSSTNLW